jgi:acetoin utilization deacetylase AcuC-like enzyme
MTTAIVTDSRYLDHTDPNHVERAERLRAIQKALEESDLQHELMQLTARAASDDELRAVHSSTYLESIQRFNNQGGGYLDPDTYMTSKSWEAATWAAGGTIRLVEAVYHGECDNGFALVRPPGHHATDRRAMGFCLINNIAVAARYATEHLGLERVAIVDYDVHHGNGTQDIFYNDSNILYCSTHASPFYPGTGLVDEIGAGDGQGVTLNVPLPPGTGDKGFERVFDQVLIPALRRWSPQMILVSAGYDAHWSDPIGPMVLSVTGYARLTRMLYELAADVCHGRIVLVLEGGYNLDALSTCVMASLQTLAGQTLDKDPLGVITAPEPQVDGVIATLLNRHPLLV